MVKIKKEGKKIKTYFKEKYIRKVNKEVNWVKVEMRDEVDSQDDVVKSRPFARRGPQSWLWASEHSKQMGEMIDSKTQKVLVG